MMYLVQAEKPATVTLGMSSTTMRSDSSLDGGAELPCLEQLAGLDLPESDGVVGAAGSEQDGARVDVDGPESTLVALVDTEALTVV
jgi:hypothetical protein